MNVGSGKLIHEKLIHEKLRRLARDQTLRMIAQPEADQANCGRGRSLENRRLASRFKDGHPEVAIWVDLISLTDCHRHGNVDKSGVPTTDDHFRPSCHRCMYGVMRQSNAVDAVVGVGRDTANGITGVDVLEIQFHPRRAKIVRDLLFEKHSDVGQFDIA